MSEPVFFNRGAGLTLAEIAALTGAQLPKAVSVDRRVFDIASLERAGPQDATFADAGREDALSRTQAGACFLTSGIAHIVPASVMPLVVSDPYRAFLQVAAKLYPDASRPSSLFEVRGAATTAQIHATARVEAGVTIDPGAVVGPRAEIGSGTVIGPLAFIGPDVRIGRDCVIGVGSCVTNALVGDGVVLHPGCRIGQSAAQISDSGKRPTLGRVILQDKVEVGANSTVDRGEYADTIVGEATVIEGLVRLAGDAMIGRYCKIVAGSVPVTVDPRDFTEPFVDRAKLFAWQVARAQTDRADL